jgi:hypothetical protein
MMCKRTRRNNRHWEQMRCSTSKLCQGHAPGTLQGLLRVEFIIALEGPGKDHFGSMVSRELHGEGCLCIPLEVQGIHVHLSCSRLQGACESQELQVLVVGFQEEFGVCCCPFRIWRQSNSSNCLQDLSRGEELLLHTQALSLDSPHQALTCILKEDSGQLAT